MTADQHMKDSALTLAPLHFNSFATVQTFLGEAATILRLPGNYGTTTMTMTVIFYKFHATLDHHTPNSALTTY